MKASLISNKNKKVIRKITDKKIFQEASLTVEAALVLPVFLYMMIAFLYFLQIFTVQEMIQTSITKMGLNLAKTAYILKEFPSIADAQSFDLSIFGEDYDVNLKELADNIASGTVLKLYSKKYLDTNQINNSCIKNGYDGISFSGSSLLNNEEYIDIIVSYQIKIPVQIFNIGEMSMLQRVRLRSWTGNELEPAYQTVEDQDNQEETVFIAETGSVYHKSASCSHIKLSVTSVQGIPTGLTNENGAKYYPCESCCSGKLDSLGTYYITSDGTRYHTKRDCSRIKRSVTEIPISEIGTRTPCKRCYN